MERDLWLSERVQSFIETEDHFSDSDLPPEERVEAQKNRKFVDVIVKDIIQSRESLTNNSLRKIDLLVEAEPELIQHFLNDYFTREVVDAVPGFVKRMMQLSRLESSSLRKTPALWRIENFPKPPSFKENPSASMFSARISSIEVTTHRFSFLLGTQAQSGLYLGRQFRTRSDFGRIDLPRGCFGLVVRKSRNGGIPNLHSYGRNASLKTLDTATKPEHIG